MSIIDNYNKIKEEIKNCAISSGRDPEDIKIISVSKTLPPIIIQEAIDSGISLFGENKIQEAKSKIPELKGDFIFQFIGHLQSNKVRDAVMLFDTIHSLDKLSTCYKVDKEAEKINKIQKILIQVNTSGEKTKNGIQPEEVLVLCEKILLLKNIDLLGFMTIGPLSDNSNSIRNSFKLLRKSLEEINTKLQINIKELSMGMSSDYKIAVEEGATFVRIGSAIFGDRSY